jgi:glutathione S-transferase
MAINLYLAKQAGKLYPTDAKSEALTWQWCLWETDRLDRQLTTYANNAFVLPEAQRNATLAKSTWEENAAAMDVLEIALARGEWLVGSAFSVADLNVASAMVRVMVTPALDSAVAKCRKCMRGCTSAGAVRLPIARSPCGADVTDRRLVRMRRAGKACRLLWC